VRHENDLAHLREGTQLEARLLHIIDEYDLREDLIAVYGQTGNVEAESANMPAELGKQFQKLLLVDDKKRRSRGIIDQEGFKRSR